MTLSLSLRPTAQTDIWMLADTMRLADVIECGLSAPGLSLHEIIRRSVELTHQPLTAVDREGEVVAIFGCSFEESRGYPWMLSTPYVTLHARALITLGRQQVAGWAAQAPFLCNWIHKENFSARRYITRLGFSIFPAPNGDFDFFFLCATPSPSA